jgi:hypothetical protein
MTGPLTARLGLLGRQTAFREFRTARVLSELGDGAAQFALVVKEELSSANALFGLAVDARVLLAPVIGAGLVTTIGVRAALLANVAFFVLSALLVLRLPAMPPGPDACGRHRLAATVTEGLRYAARHPVVRPLVRGALPGHRVRCNGHVRSCSSPGRRLAS